MGDEIEFRVNALPDKKFTAKVNYIDPFINQNTRTALLRAEIANRGGKLKPQMFVQGNMTAFLKHKANALLVPKSAVMWTGKGNRKRKKKRLPEPILNI